MATQTPTENAADVSQTSSIQRPVGKSKTNKIIIGQPFEAAGKVDNIISYIQVDEGPKLASGWKVKKGSVVTVAGKGLGIYNQIALWVGGARELLTGGDVRKRPGGTGLEFTARFTNDRYSDGSSIEVEFLQENRPNNDRTLQNHFLYLAEEEKDKKAKGGESEKTADSSSGKKSGGPAALMMEAVGDTLGGIAGALGSGASSSGQVKTMSQSGTSSSLGGNVSSAGATGQASSVSSVEQDADDDVLQSSEQQASSQTVTSSTAEVVGSSETISQGATVSGQQTTEVSSGGTVQASQAATVSGTVSGTQSQSVSGTLEAGGATVSASGGGATVSVAGSSQPSSGGLAKVEGILQSQANISGQGQVQAQGLAPASGGSGIQSQVSGTANLNQTASAGIQGTATAGSAPISQSGTVALGLNLGTSGTVSASLNQTQPEQSASAGQTGAGTTSGAPQISPTAAAASASPSTAPPQTPTISAAKLSSPASAPNAQTFPAPGKGKVDGIDQADQPSSTKDQVPPPSAGVEDMIGRLAKNQKNLDNKLDSPTARQGKGSDTAVPRGQTAGADPLQNLQTASEAGTPKAEFPRLAPPLISPSKGGGAGQPEGLAPKLISPSKGGGAGEPRLAPPTISPSKGGGAGKPPGLAPKTISPGKEDETGEPQQGQGQPPLAAPPGNQAPKQPGSGLEDLEGKVVGEATSQLWWWGFGIAAATFFTGLDFFGGAVIMDAYWVFFYRKEPKLFPLKGYQKFLTVIAHLLPFVWASFFFGLVLYAGCTFPLGAPISSATNFKASIMGVAGHADICQAFMSFPAGISGALNGAVAPSTPPTPSAGSCSVMPSGDASPVQLSATCFSAVATQASMVAVKESGGNPAVGSGSDICQDANGNQRTLNGKPEVVSWGLFQINLTAHQVAGLNCPSAFDKLYTAGNHQCQVINVSLYNQCVAAVQDPQTNIQLACQIYQSQGWGAWGTAAQACVNGH